MPLFSFRKFPVLLAMNLWMSSPWVTPLTPGTHLCPCPALVLPPHHPYLMNHYCACQLFTRHFSHNTVYRDVFNYVFKKLDIIKFKEVKSVGFLVPAFYLFTLSSLFIDFFLYYLLLYPPLALFPWAPKSLQMVSAAMKLKDACLLLERTAMTNLDSILKSRDITLPTKIHLVKALVFLAVLYGCEGWTIKKAECWRTDAFDLWCWRRLLRVP